MRRRPTAAMTGEAAGDREPMTTKQSSTAQRIRMSAWRVAGAGLGWIRSICDSTTAYLRHRNFWRLKGIRKVRSRTAIKTPTLDIQESLKILQFRIGRKVGFRPLAVRRGV